MKLSYFEDLCHTSQASSSQEGIQAFSGCNMALLSVTELESCSLATELAVLTELIWPLLWARETYMGSYMSLFSGISSQRSAARAAHTAQVSVARLGHLPHLLPHSLALADMAGRALTKNTPTGSSISRSRPEAIFLHICCGFGFASPFFALFLPSLSPLLPLCSNKRWRMIPSNLLRKHRSSLFYDGCE